MKILINFANGAFKEQRKYNSLTGKKIGKFDKIIEFSPLDIEASFYGENWEILGNSKGGGYWLWKPYFLLKTLNEAEYGDYIFYCDAGSYFVKPIDLLIEFAKANKEDMLIFEQPLLNVQYAKKEFIHELRLNNSEWAYENLALAGFILVKKTTENLKFIEEYLNMCTSKSLISDPESGQRQHPEFISHRHDQTILSYLVWRNNIKMYRDISQYGFLQAKYMRYGISKIGFSYVKVKKYQSCTYPTIVHLYRREKLYAFFPRMKFEFKLKIELFLSKKVLGF